MEDFSSGELKMSQLCVQKDAWCQLQFHSLPLITVSFPGCMPVLPALQQSDTRATGSLEYLTEVARRLLAATIICSSKTLYHRTWQMLFKRFPEVFASYPRYTMQLYFATIFEMLTHQISFLTISMQSVFFILLKGYQIQQITFLVKKILQGCHHPGL